MLVFAVHPARALAFAAPSHHHYKYECLTLQAHERKEGFWTPLLP